MTMNPWDNLVVLSQQFETETCSTVRDIKTNDSPTMNTLKPHESYKKECLSDVEYLGTKNRIEERDKTTHCDVEIETINHVKACEFKESDDFFPDLHELFLFYDSCFFFSQLQSVEVRWSKRMTLCAGVCVYNKGGYCSIRLSQPLLVYRSVQNLKETLLHEMIHAYLFVTKKIVGRDGHGVEFQRHMDRINNLTGLNVTIYHTFKDEVDNYRRHIWRCTGSCRNRPPFYGILKRAINRAPGPYDFWWSKHKETCGGNYQKISPLPIEKSLVFKKKKLLGKKDVLT